MSNAKIEPESKDCKTCKVHKKIEEFKLTPTKYNPNLRSLHCLECFKKYIRDYNKDNDVYRKQYASMTPEERKETVKRKGEMNKIRIRSNPEALKKRRDYEKTDRRIYQRYSNDCRRRTRLTRGIKMELTLEQFSQIINKPCQYCGLEKSRGVDRIDSYKSYTVDNSISCCKTCNQMKSDIPIETFLEHIKKIIKHFSKL